MVPKREAQNPVPRLLEVGAPRKSGSDSLGWLSVALMGSHFGGLPAQVSADRKKLNR